MAATRAGDIGDAGGEHALLAREFFIDEVGDAMGSQAQVALWHHIALAAKVLGLDHIPQAETDIETPIGQAVDTAGHQRVGRLLPPHAHVRAAGFVQHGASSINGAELPAALQVGLHNGRNLLRGLRFATKWRNHDGQLGQSHPCHFNTELCKRRQGRGACQRHQHGAARQMA